MTSIPNPPPRWSQSYSEDLERYPHLREALEEADPIYVVAKRAKLSDAQAWVLRAWADGRSHRDIAQDLHRSLPTTQALIGAALYKTLLWLVRS